MKIALSNLAFSADDAASILPGLAAMGLAGIEVAPTRLAPWAELTAGKIADYKSLLGDLGLAIPSLQAIFFAAEGVALLGDEQAYARMIDHLRIVARHGAGLGAKVAVLGAPRQRSRGDLPADDAFALGTERLRRAAEIMIEEGGPALGLEPVPGVYGGDFLPTAAEVHAMVLAVDHPGLRLHLDTGCAYLGGDDIGATIRAGAAELAHFQIAEPELGGFANPVADHAGAAAALIDVGYGGWVSIEMKEAAKNPGAACREALAFVQQAY